MADDLESQAPGSTPSTELPTGDSPAVGSPPLAAKTIRATEQLLAAYHAGEPITDFSERGRIGAHLKAERKAAERMAGSGVPMGEPSPAGSGQPGMDSLPEGQALDDLPSRVPVDPALVRRTTASVLRAIDSAALSWLDSEASRAGVNAEGRALLAERAAMGKETQDLVADVSPDIFAQLGVDPRNYPLFTAVSMLGLWGFGISQAVTTIRKMHQPVPPRPSPDVIPVASGAAREQGGVS